VSSNIIIVHFAVHISDGMLSYIQIHHGITESFFSSWSSDRHPVLVVCLAQSVLSNSLSYT
jgi:hypothetical protein